GDPVATASFCRVRRGYRWLVTRASPRGPGDGGLIAGVGAVLVGRRHLMTTTWTPAAGVGRRTPTGLRHLRYDIWFPLTVYALTRAVDAVMIVLASRHQVALLGADPSYHLNYSSPADPGYALIAANWDGQWYRRIAE